MKFFEGHENFVRQKFCLRKLASSGCFCIGDGNFVVGNLVTFIHTRKQLAFKVQ